MTIAQLDADCVALRSALRRLAVQPRYLRHTQLRREKESRMHVVGWMCVQCDATWASDQAPQHHASCLTVDRRGAE